MREDGIKAFKVEGDRPQMLGLSSLEKHGFKERKDLQAWLEAQPQIVGNDLLLVTTEFDQWEQGSGNRVRDRLDMLFIDGDSRLVVCELKRGTANDSTDLQALKYASYCSTLTVEDVTSMYAQYHEVDEAEAELKLSEQISEVSGLAKQVRVVLIAEEFGPALTHTVLWLREHDVDMRCIEINVFSSSGDVFITANPIIPPPEAEEFMVKKREKEREEESIERRNKRGRSVRILVDNDALEVGEELTLNLDQFTSKLKSHIEKLVLEKPDIARAEWTGDLKKSLKWRHDGKSYSCTMATNNVREMGGFSAISLPGPSFWQTANGETLYQIADRLAKGQPAEGDRDG